MPAVKNNLFFNIFFLIFIIIVAIERIHSTFLLKKRSRQIYQRWSTFVPLMTYIGIILFAIIEYLLTSKKINFFVSFLGLVIFISGVIIRKWSLRALGEDWNIDVDAANVREIITKGPYRYLRHPYSLAVIFELLGFSLVSNSYWAILFVFLIQLPLLLTRIYLEEKKLIEKFKNDYLNYKSSVWAILPIRKLVLKKEI